MARDKRGAVSMRLLLKIFGGILALALVVLIGGYAALYRPDIPYTKLEQKYANEASKFMDMGDGVRVHYRDQGTASGRTLLMIHGYAASLHTWEPWVQLLGAEYRIVSLDLPGHGLTQAPKGWEKTVTGRSYPDLVDAFMAKLDIDKAVIVGSSMGGGAAWTMALEHPARVEGLVLVGAAGWRQEANNVDERPAIFKILQTPVVGPMIRDLDTTQLTRQGLKASFVNKAMVDEAMVARYVEMSRAPGHRAILLGLQGARDRRVASPELMKNITAPALILHGEQDNLVPVAGGRKFDEFIPDSEGIFYDQVGHIPQEEIAERSANDLRGWLQRRFPIASPAGAPLMTGTP
jgi:pimeloyl-ACP methyl ester carboxylesterase